MPTVLRTRSLRSARYAARAPKVALLAVASILAAVGLRTLLHPAVAPPPAPRPTTASVDLAAQALAQRFARAYLTWRASDPAGYAAQLDEFLPEGVSADQIARLPRAGSQIVTSTAVSADRATRDGRRVTVDAETDAGHVRLSIDIVRDPAGGLAVSPYPAIIGPVPTGKSLPDVEALAVDSVELEATTTRALRNYLAGARENLAADLVPGARVEVPDAPLRLQAVDELTWRKPGRAIRAVVIAKRTGQPQLTLAYELGVVRQAERWFVSWIQEPHPLTTEESQ